MKMKSVFVFLYSFFPILFISAYSAIMHEWKLLFGIIFTYIGVNLAIRSRSFFYLFTLFLLGFWTKEGFHIHQYLTFFYLCTLWGFFCCLMVHEDSVINMTKEDYDKKMSEKTLRYLSENPTQKLDFDKMSAIHDEVIKESK